MSILASGSVWGRCNRRPSAAGSSRRRTWWACRPARSRGTARGCRAASRSRTPCAIWAARTAAESTAVAARIWDWRSWKAQANGLEPIGNESPPRAMAWRKYGSSIGIIRTGTKGLSQRRRRAGTILPESEVKPAGGAAKVLDAAAQCGSGRRVITGLHFGIRLPRQGNQVLYTFSSIAAGNARSVDEDYSKRNRHATDPAQHGARLDGPDPGACGLQDRADQECRRCRRDAGPATTATAVALGHGFRGGVLCGQDPGRRA